MGKRYLIDTNVLIDFIGSVLPGAVHSKISEIINEDFNISFVNKIEVLGYNATNQVWIDFINEATMIGIDDDIIAETIRIRKNHKIKLPDAVVGATC